MILLADTFLFETLQRKTQELSLIAKVFCEDHPEVKGHLKPEQSCSILAINIQQWLLSLRIFINWEGSIKVFKKTICYKTIWFDDVE